MKEKITAIVLAAGQGKRMHSKVQKQFLEIQDHPVLYYSLRCFQDSLLIDDIILVTGNDMISYCKNEIVGRYSFTKVSIVIAGGKERYDSVYAGLRACENCDYVFIHDGARPFLTDDMIIRGKEAVLAYGACVTGMPSKDTIKIADENGMVVSTPRRSLVWNIQTPQIFSYTAIREAYEEARQQSMEDITDDAMVMERFGNLKIKLVEGSYENIKITTPEDILVAEKILEKN